MRCSVRWLLRLSMFAAGLLLALPSARAAESFPNIKYVGIIPVQWQGDFPSDPSFPGFRERLERDFPSLVRESRRFIFVNDTIIADHWSTPTGRKTLAEDYEVDGFVNLVVSGQQDVFLYSVRLLGPGLENYLSETETIPRAWIAAAGAGELQERLRRLVFRVLNRYPLDVYVTSLQGRYITLSSGKDQNVFDGDELTFIDVDVRSRHPVDGSWLTFEQKALGKARVVESKSQSAIAQITSLNSENAIRVGSGARVDAIASRRLFQEKPKTNEAFLSVEDNSPIVVPKGTKPNPPVPKAEAKPPKFAQAEMPDEPMPLPSAADNPAVTGGGPAMTAEDDELPENQASSEALDSFFPFDFRNTRFSLETESLSFGKSATMTSQMPGWLINRGGISGDIDISSDMILATNAFVRSGNNKNGNYSGFGLGVEGLMWNAMTSGFIPSLERVLFGLSATIESVGVSGASFGGWDVLQLGPVAHMQGSYHVAELVETFEYDFSFRYALFSSGSAGIRGKARDMESGSQMDLLGQVVRKAHADEMEWGGLVGLSQGTWDLSKGRVSQNSFRLGVVGRIKL